MRSSDLDHFGGSELNVDITKLCQRIHTGAVSGDRVVVVVVALLGDDSISEIYAC